MRPPGRGAGAPCAVAVLLLTASEPVSGQHACDSDYAALHAEYEEKCCGSKGCSGEPPVPSGCSTTCARVWSPFMLRCSTWVEEAMPELAQFNHLCETTSYGHADQRCSDESFQSGLGRVETSCCGIGGSLCSNSPVPESCSNICANTYQLFFAQCHRHIETNGMDEEPFTAFLNTCQNRRGAAGLALARPPPPPLPSLPGRPPPGGSIGAPQARASDLALRIFAR